MRGMLKKSKRKSSHHFMRGEKENQCVCGMSEARRLSVGCFAGLRMVSAYKEERRVVLDLVWVLPVAQEARLFVGLLLARPWPTCVWSSGSASSPELSICELPSSGACSASMRRGPTAKVKQLETVKRTRK